MYRIIEHKIKHQYAVYEYSICASKHYGRPEWIRASAYYSYFGNAENYAKMLAQANLEAQI